MSPKLRPAPAKEVETSSDSSESETTSGSDGGMQDDDEDIRHVPGHVPDDDLLSLGTGTTSLVSDNTESEDSSE